MNGNSNLYCKYFAGAATAPNALLLETAEGVKYSYADAERRASQLAHHLLNMGLQPGDRVTVRVEKSPYALWLYFGCLKAGLVFHPLNTAYTESELAYFIEDAVPSLIVCDSRDKTMMLSLARQFEVPHVETLNSDGFGTLLQQANQCPEDFVPMHRDPDDLAALLYSSGTTGRPKGIMLTQRNLHENAATLGRIWGFTAQDRLLHALPIYHVHGLFVAIGCVMMSACSMRWLRHYSVAEVIRFLPECTVFMGVPTYYTRLLDNPAFGSDTCAYCRLFISGSAPLLKETFVKFQQRTGHTILERYGMTETGMNTSNPLDGVRKAGTVGLPLPGVEVRIADDQGNPVAVAETGHVQIRGANVFKGYWRMPEKTAEDFTVDGFFVTGDEGTLDTEGYVSIVGRANDMIISGGLNIYPKEIELLLNELQGIKESAVIGVAHPDFGEAVIAVIASKPDSMLGEQAVIESVKGRLAGFKIPKRVFFVDELPRNTMSKVQKNLLREQYADCFRSA